jgi:hypothetical protein
MTHWHATPAACRPAPLMTEVGHCVAAAAQASVSAHSKSWLPSSLQSPTRRLAQRSSPPAYAGTTYQLCLRHVGRQTDPCSDATLPTLGGGMCGSRVQHQHDRPRSGRRPVTVPMWALAELSSRGTLFDNMPTVPKWCERTCTMITPYTVACGRQRSSSSECRRMRSAVTCRRSAGSFEATRRSVDRRWRDRQASTHHPTCASCFASAASTIQPLHAHPDTSRASNTSSHPTSGPSSPRHSDPPCWSITHIWSRSPRR